MQTICCLCKAAIKVSCSDPLCESTKWIQVGREVVELLEVDLNSHGYCTKCMMSELKRIGEERGYNEKDTLS